MRRPVLDLLIENADVVTLDPQRPEARRIGVLDGRIVGLDEQLDAWDATERVDLDGGCVVPGFVDAHTHLELTGQTMASVDISGCRTSESVLDLIADVSLTLADDDWVEVGGYDHRVLGRHLAAGELDAAMLDNTASGQFVSENPRLKLSREFDTGEQYGFAVAKDQNDELLKTVNDVLATAKEDGTYEKLFRKYFPDAEFTIPR